MKGWYHLEYSEFLAQKRFVVESSGFDIDKSELNPMLFEFQKDIVRWALKKGKANIFADCGLGKTPMQLSWAHQVHLHTGGKVLILAPLAVADQTKREAGKFGYDAKVVSCQEECTDGINITNYEKLDHFISSEFVGIVLDESSILKSYTGKVRTSILDRFRNTPYKLACTATPAPNDYMELGNHAEFCGVMTRSEMLAMFFVHDGGSTSKWRLKGHANDVFWQWLASFSVFVDNPKHIGYAVDGYDLPELNVVEDCIDGEPSNETLTLTERRNAKREGIESKSRHIVDVLESAGVLNKTDGVMREKYIIWCDLNKEQDTIAEMLGENCVSIQGSTPDKKKVEYLDKWLNEDVPVLISKGSIFGYGLNFQNCHNMIFFGLNDSFETYYQSVRRCWRFGQEHDVNVRIVIVSKEGCVRDNIMRKQEDFDFMQEEMTKYTKEITQKELRSTCRLSTPYEPSVKMTLPKWEEFAA